MADLVRHDIIDITTGAKVGRLCDFTVDSDTATVKCLIVYGKRSFFGLIKSGEDIVIPWCDVKMFGKDTILITKCPVTASKKRRGIISGIVDLFKA